MCIHTRSSCRDSLLFDRSTIDQLQHLDVVVVLILHVESVSSFHDHSSVRWVPIAETILILAVILDTTTKGDSEAIEMSWRARLAADREV